MNLESLDDAAIRVGCHPRTLRRRVADGSLPAVRLGKKLVRVDPAHVDALFHPIPTMKTAA